MEIILLFYHCKCSVYGTWKIKSAINGSENIKKNYSPVDKSLVGEGAGEEDVYEQYLEALGGLNKQNDQSHKEQHYNCFVWIWFCGW